MLTTLLRLSAMPLINQVGVKEMEIFVPHTDQEIKNVEALQSYLDQMFFC